MNNKLYNTLGIIGNPLKQSLSPSLHNYWLKQNCLKYNYRKFQINDINDLGMSLKKSKIKGFNVTIPFKKEIIQYLDKLDKTSSVLQAVNTVKNNDGILEGYNTDVSGFMTGLKYFKKLNVKKPALIIGAGGASEAIIYSLISKGFKEIFVMNRTRKRAEALEEKYKEVSIKNWMKKEAINASGLIVNTSSLGMIGYPNLLLSLKDAEKDTKVYDIVYNPLKTSLILEAEKNDLEYVTGLAMFIGQAQKSFQIWFNIEPKVNSYLKKKLKSEIFTA